MTVLAKYQRLEAEAVWRADPDAQRRDVIVSIGEATLTVTDMNENPLTHWSLPAIRRLNPGERPALYSPGEDAPETLEIADPAMIEAIGKVLKAIRRRRAHPGRLRGGMLAGVTVVLVSLAVFWFPGAVARYTAGIVPQAARTAAGAALLSDVARVTGAPCGERSGVAALRRLTARLFPEGGVTVSVVPSALETTAHLPGGLLLVGRSLVEDYETPDVLAGHLLAEGLRRETTDPFERLLRDAGLPASLRLLSTGRLADETLRAHAEGLVASAPKPVRETDLAARMAAADVAAGPYLASIGRDTEDPSPSATPLLSDSDWIALQQICEG